MRPVCVILEHTEAGGLTCSYADTVMIRPQFGDS